MYNENVLALIGGVILIIAVSYLSFTGNLAKLPFDFQTKYQELRNNLLISTIANPNQITQGAVLSLETVNLAAENAIEQLSQNSIKTIDTTVKNITKAIKSTSKSTKADEVQTSAITVDDSSISIDLSNNLSKTTLNLVIGKKYKINLKNLVLGNCLYFGNQKVDTSQNEIYMTFDTAGTFAIKTQKCDINQLEVGSIDVK